MKTSKGTKMPRGDKKAIMEYIVNVLDYETQKKTGYLLHLLDRKIKLNNCINKNLEEQAQAVFKSWFVNFEPFGRIMPDNWQKTTLGTITSIYSGKRPRKKLSETTSEFCFPLVGAASVMGYTNEYNHNNKILVIGRVGTHGVVQRFNCPCWTSDNTLVIESKYHEFVYQILQRIDYKNMNCGSTQPLITQSDLKKVSIILPTENYLAKFEKISNNLMCKFDYNKKENQRLSALRDILIPKLINGETNIFKI